MKLYVTDRGTWGGTQAEMPAKCREDGSPAGGWREVEVPTKKATLIEFLNHNKVMGTPEPRVRQRPPPPPATGSGRYRVNGGIREKVFISSTRADSPEEACAQVAATLYAYQPGD